MQKAKGVKLELSENIMGSVEVNQNIPHACRLSKRRISNILGTAYGIKLKLSWCDEGNVQLTKRQYAHTATTTNTTTTKMY